MMNPHAARVLAALATAYVQQRASRAFSWLKRAGIIDAAERSKLIGSFMCLAWREAYEPLVASEEVLARYHENNEAFMAEYALWQRIVDQEMRFDLLSALLGRERWNGPRLPHHVDYVAEITAPSPWEKCA